MTGFKLGDYVRLNDFGLRIIGRPSRPGRKSTVPWVDRVGLVKGFSREAYPNVVRIKWVNTGDTPSIRPVHAVYLERVWPWHELSSTEEKLIFPKRSIDR